MVPAFEQDPEHNGSMDHEATDKATDKATDEATDKATDASTDPRILATDELRAMPHIPQVS